MHFYPKQRKKIALRDTAKKKVNKRKLKKKWHDGTKSLVYMYEANDMSSSTRAGRKRVIMSVWEKRDDRTVDKHTDRPIVHCRFPQTRPRVAPRSRSHRRCATKLRHYYRRSACHRPGSGGARRVYSAHRQRTHRDGRARRRAYSVLVVERRVP